MKKVALFVICAAFCAAQTATANAQAVSSGMMSSSTHQKKLHVTQNVRVQRPVHARAVASAPKAADPITTGSIGKPKN
jgi:hypothetical protein